MSTSRVRPAPGPEAWRFLGTLRSVHKDRLAFLRDMSQRYGDVTRFHLGTREVLLVSGPEAARHILKTREQNYRKGMGLSDSRGLLGQGLLTNEGAFWKTQREKLQPLFGPQRVESYVSAMVEETAAMTTRWRRTAQEGGSVDLTAEMMRLTMRILGRTLFGTRFGESLEVIEASMTAAMRHAMTRMIFPASAWLPTPGNLGYRRAVARMDGLVQELMSRQRREGEGEVNILSALVGGDVEALSPQERQQIRDELVTLIVAGHETTTVLLCWTWVLLAQHPTEWERVRAEVREVLGDETATLQHLSRLQHCRRVLEESMRLYPPVWILPRRAVEDDELHGFPVRAGTDVLVSPYTLHRHPGSWESPEEFIPDRFLPARSGARSPFAYLPFGLGPRGCIGKYFGMVEAQCVLALVTREFRLELAPGTRLEAEPLLTLRPRHSLRALPIAG